MEVSGKKAELMSESCKLCVIEGLSTQADGYCNECDEHMCNKCFQHHVKAKSCRNHVLSPLGQSVPLSKKLTGSNEKCKIHVNEIVKYYCRKHDVVTCGDCIVGDHHGCKMEFISKLAENFENSSEFKDIVRKIEKLGSERKENKAQLDSNRKENKTCLDTALAEIKKFRKDINEHLDKMENEILFEANTLAKQNDDIIDEVEKMLSVAKQDIDDIRNTFDSNMIQGETLFIRTKEYKPKLSKVEENVTFIRTKNVIKGFTLEQEKTLTDMIESGVRLGCLRRDTVREKEPSVIQKTKQPTVKPVMTNVSADKQVVTADKQVVTADKQVVTADKQVVTADKQVDAKQGYLLTEEAPTVKQKSRQSFETVNPVLSVTAEKNVEAKQSYLPPDPRAAGFDVGVRVKCKYMYTDWRPYNRYNRYDERGVVTQVDPTGYVTVRWDRDGSESREYAGAEGRFYVKLLPK